MEEKPLSHEESLVLINRMIGKAKNNYYDTGAAPILWGTVISICAFVTFLEIIEVIKMPFEIWWLTCVAVVLQILIVIKEVRSQRVTDYDDVAMGYIWGVYGFGIGLLVFIELSVFTHLIPMQEEYKKLAGHAAKFKFSEYTSSFFLLWYGFPGIITGAG